MENPWGNLKSDKKQYILDIDSDVIKKINDNFHGDYRLRLDLFPEPFIGNPEAPVYFLNLNPGCGDENNIQDKEDMKILKDYVFKNLKHKKAKYPFYILDPKLKTMGGAGWWRKKLGNGEGVFKLLDHEKMTDKLAANNIFCVEYFPYHSRKFKQIGKELWYKYQQYLIPSQEYSFELVKNAMKKKKIIIIMRSKNIWFNAVESLRKYKYAYVLKNPQAVTISRKNFTDERILDKIIGRILSNEKNNE